MTNAENVQSRPRIAFSTPGDDIVRDPNAFIRGRWNGWDLEFSHHISPVAA